LGFAAAEFVSILLVAFAPIAAALLSRLACTALRRCSSFLARSVADILAASTFVAVGVGLALVAGLAGVVIAGFTAGGWVGASDCASDSAPDINQDCFVSPVGFGTCVWVVAAGTVV